MPVDHHVENLKSSPDKDLWPLSEVQPISYHLCFPLPASAGAGVQDCTVNTLFLGLLAALPSAPEVHANGFGIHFFRVKLSEMIGWLLYGLP